METNARRYDHAPGGTTVRQAPKGGTTVPPAVTRCTVDNPLTHDREPKCTVGRVSKHDRASGL